MHRIRNNTIVRDNCNCCCRFDSAAVTFHAPAIGCGDRTIGPNMAFSDLIQPGPIELSYSHTRTAERAYTDTDHRRNGTVRVGFRCDLTGGHSRDENTRVRFTLIRFRTVKTRHRKRIFRLPPPPFVSSILPCNGKPCYRNLNISVSVLNFFLFLFFS